jgi:hypothetical protein
VLARLAGQTGPLGRGPRATGVTPAWTGQAVCRGWRRRDADGWSPPSEQCSAPRQPLRNILDDVAGLQKLIFSRVASRVALETIHQDHGWDPRRPEPLLAQGKNQSQRGTRALGKTSDGSRIQNQQVLAGIGGRPSCDSLSERLRPRPLSCRRLSYLRDQGIREAVRLREQVASTHLCSNGTLQELRCRQTTLLHEAVEIVRQVDLHARHTPNYTPCAPSVNARALRSLSAQSVWNDRLDFTRS